jgi:hypothetical protein
MSDALKPVITQGSSTRKSVHISELPPLPDLRTFIGREEAVIEIVARLRASLEQDWNRKTVMRGWPGVGKTTLAIVVAHHPEVTRLFPDGIFWTSLGDNPDLMSEFTIWGYMLDIGGFKTINDAQDRLSAIFERKRALLIVDDVYEIEHGSLFGSLGGPYCATLFTTRFPLVAEGLTDNPGRDIYLPEQLADDDALVLLRELCPEAVERYPEDAQALVTDLEGLPLAIQVAGRTLQVEQGSGFYMPDLLADLRNTTRIISEQSPDDRPGVAQEIHFPVGALLMKSIDRLSAEIRLYFASLGAFAPKPASFEREAMKVVWQLSDPEAVIQQLVGRGLLEYEHTSKRYHMHALLTRFARHLLETPDLVW